MVPKRVYSHALTKTIKLLFAKEYYSLYLREGHGKYAVLDISLKMKISNFIYTV